MSEENPIQVTLPPPDAETTPDGKRIEPLPALKKFDRLTFTCNIHHEHRGDSPVSVPIIAAIPLETFGLEPWSRRIEIGEDWQTVPLGWLDPNDVGYIVIENNTGKDALVHPTPEERERISKAVLLVAFDNDRTRTLETPPGLPFIGRPSKASNLIMRCKSGVANLRVTVFPR